MPATGNEAAPTDRRSLVVRAIRTVLDSPEHAWLKRMSAADRAKIDAYYRERYGAETVKWRSEVRSRPLAIPDLDHSLVAAS